MDQTNWQQRRDILISVICIGIILWAIWNIAGQFVDAIVILLLSMAVAFLLTPAVNYLVRYNVPRLVAVIIVYTVVGLLLFFFGYELIFSLVNQVRNFSDTVINFFSVLPQTVTDFEKFLREQGGIPQANIDDAINQIRSQAVGFAQSAASNALNIALLVTNAFLNIVLVAVLSFYLTLDGKRIRDSIISIVPQRSMSHALLFEGALNRVVGNYIRGQLTLALIVGILAGAVGLIPGMNNYALIIGVLAFLFETIPMVGPALASIPAVLISLLLPDPFPRTFYVIAWFIGIQAIESNILGPRIVGHAVGLHPVASIMALLVGAKLFGVFGALLATPIVAASWVVVASIYRSARGETPEQILSRRRAPWTMRRPTGQQLRNRRKVEGLDSSHPDYVRAGTPTKELRHIEVKQDEQNESSLERHTHVGDQKETPTGG